MGAQRSPVDRLPPERGCVVTTGRRAVVRLGAIVVGELVEDELGAITFRIDRAYEAMPDRPVLGQWFEDHPRVVHRGERPGRLPAYFWNLIPEGDLRLLLAERNGISLGDDFGLLCAVGNDLPGAIVVEPAVGVPPVGVESRVAEPGDSGFQFSLAGVQLKFSLVARGGRFALPGRGERGDWIAKIAFAAYPQLAQNEWVTMDWARRLGFEVPERELVPLGELTEIPHEGDPASLAYLIRRYDRDGARRIHQEDLQQVAGRRPDGKYDDVTYDKLGIASRALLGDDGSEFLRRLAFIVASGNSDAHMKNWSVIYRDGVTATWSPLYDQVFVCQWSNFRQRSALKIDGTKEWAALDVGHLKEFAGRVGEPPQRTLDLFQDVIRRAATVWGELRDHPHVTSEYRQALREHWRRVPLLRPHALLI